MTVYQGVPYDLPGGSHLYTTEFISGVDAQSLTRARQRKLLDHTLRSRSDAQSLVRQLELGRLAAMSARNRELFALLPASLLLTAGFAAIFIQRHDVLSNVSLTYGAIFLGLCLAAHLVLRFTLPHADPYLFPLVALLACFGLVMIYRIDDKLAREQAQWFVIGLALLRGDDRLPARLPRLERYRYTDRDRLGIGAAAAAAPAGIGRRSTAPTSASGSGRSRSSRPSSPRSASSSSWPATCATRARCWSRRAALRRADDPAAQALRAAAVRVRRGDGRCCSSSATSARR